MNESKGYAVFFFPQALEALGEAIKPYLVENAAGAHVLCTKIDTSGSLIEMTLEGKTLDGKVTEVELMVPSGMVRMIASAHSEDTFGFGRRSTDPRMTLPVLGPTAAPANVHSDALPETTRHSAPAVSGNVSEPKP